MLNPALNAVFLILALAAGYVCKKTRLLSPDVARGLMVRIQQMMVPCILFVSFWGLSMNARMWQIPFYGVAVIAMQFSLCYLMLKLFKVTPIDRGTFYVAAVLSNVGFLGWTVNLSLFGQSGYDYAFLYSFYFTFAVYFVAYPIAAHFTPSASLKNLTFGKRIGVEGILYRIVIAMALGALLNLLQIERPLLLGTINNAVVVLATLCMMFAAGLTIRVRSFHRYLRQSGIMTGMKLVISPLAMVALFALLKPSGSDSMIFKVVVVEAMMPLAISCLSVSAIFHLNQDLMNAMWASSTALFLIAFGIFNVIS